MKPFLIFLFLFSSLAFAEIKTAIKSGTKIIATAGAAEPLVASNTPVNWVVIKATQGNTGNISIGNSGSQDIEFTAEGTIKLEAASINGEVRPLDLNTVFVDSTVNGEGVQFIYGIVEN